MKRFALLMLVLVCFSLTAFAADVPAGDVFGGFSIAHQPSQTTYGWQASAAANIHPMVGIVGDFGGQYKTVNSVKVKNYQYLFGPRFNARMDKVTYFGEAFFGGDHATSGSGSGNAFAMAYGGGVDVQAGKVSIRVIQFDWIPMHTSGGWNNKGTRYGFGVVVPFGKK